MPIHLTSHHCNICYIYECHLIHKFYASQNCNICNVGMFRTPLIQSRMAFIFFKGYVSCIKKVFSFQMQECSDSSFSLSISILLISYKVILL